MGCVARAASNKLAHDRQSHAPSRACAKLPTFLEGSPQRTAARISLGNIRWVLSRAARSIAFFEPHLFFADGVTSQWRRWRGNFCGNPRIVRPQDLAIFNFLDEARPCCPFRSFANPDAELSRVLVILFGCFFERLNSRVDARHLSINISEPASPPTISISHSAVRSDSNLPSFRPHSRRRFTTFAIIAARTSVMTSAIVANKLSKSCHAQVTPI